MSIFRAPLIAAAVLAMTPSATFAQVRVITGDTEHVYGSSGQLLDDAELRAKNERIERARQIEKQRRQEKLMLSISGQKPDTIGPFLISTNRQSDLDQ